MVDRNLYTHAAFMARVDEGGPVSQQDSFDFEQDDLHADQDSEDSKDSDGWGSEFDGNDDFDEYEVEADTSGRMNSVDMMHKAFWEKLNVIDEAQAERDSTGRCAYVRACQRQRLRPSVTALLALGEEKLQLQVTLSVLSPLLPAAPSALAFFPSHRKILTQGLQYLGMRAGDAVAIAEGLEYNSISSVANLSGNSFVDASQELGRAIRVILNSLLTCVRCLTCMTYGFLHTVRSSRKTTC